MSVHPSVSEDVHRNATAPWTATAKPAPAPILTTAPPRPELLAAALAYARRGWRVTPLAWVTTGLDGTRTCSCWKRENCGRPSAKHPLFTGWRTSATADVPTVVRWWKAFPRAGIGLAMGGPARLVAIDIDGDAGRASLTALEAQHDPLPNTWTQTTGRDGGGEHRVFVVPDELEIDAIKNRVKLADGIDVRADGGFIVGSPSEHMSGALYTVSHDIEPAPMPVWLYKLISDRYRAARTRLQIAGDDRPDERELPSMQERIDRGVGLCRAHRPAIQGQDGSGTLMSLAVALVRGLCLPIQDAVDLIEEHYNAKCVPPWTPHEIVHKASDAEFASVKQWGFLMFNPVFGPTFEPTLGGKASAGESAGDETIGAHHHWRSPSGLNETSPDDNAVAEPAARDQIMVGREAVVQTPTVDYATVKILGSQNKSGQHHLQLRVLDGLHVGLKKDWPLDWPTTSRSTEKWRHVAAAVGVGAIAHPRDVFGALLRAELIKNERGVLEVHRVYAPIAADHAPR